MLLGLFVSENLWAIEDLILPSLGALQIPHISLAGCDKETGLAGRSQPIPLKWCGPAVAS